MKDQISENKLKRNGEGYPDPTAYRAIKNLEGPVENEEERFRKFIGAILRICELSDFHLEEHIVVKDERTGRIWR